MYLVAPTTTPARRAVIAARSGGFLYCVSLVGVTGARTTLPPTVAKLVRDVKAASPVPVAVGFGVSKPAHVRAIARAGADGVVVASALVDALGPDGRDVARARPARRGAAGGDGRWPMTRGCQTASRSTSRPAQEGVRVRSGLAGLGRAGKDEELALAALADARRATRRSRRPPASAVPGRRRCDFEVVERIEGGAGTAFGVPGANAEGRPRPGQAGRGARLAALVEAAWTIFDRTRARSPE